MQWKEGISDCIACTGTNALPTVNAAGDELPIYTVGDLTLGIFICHESNYYYYSLRYSAGFQLRRRDA
jgi:hypothetical protein